MYRRRYESRRLSKPKLHFKKQNRNKIWRKTICNIADRITLQCGTIMTFISPGDCTLQCGMWLWNHDSEFTRVAAPCNVIRGSGMTCSWIRPNVRHIGILHLVSILTISPQSACHSAPVCEILCKSDNRRQKKWRHVDFQNGGSQPSWILRISDAFFENPMYDFL